MRFKGNRDNVARQQGRLAYGLQLARDLKQKIDFEQPGSAVIVENEAGGQCHSKQKSPALAGSGPREQNLRRCLGDYVPTYTYVKRAPRRPTKRSITLGELKTSVTLEDAFWDALREIAIERGMPVRSLVAAIRADSRQPNLSSALRVFVLRYYVDQQKT